MALVDLKLSEPALFIQRGYINGDWVLSSNGATFPVIDPSTGTPFSTVPNHSRDDYETAIQHAHRTFEALKTTTNEYTRSSWLFRWNQLILQHADDLAAILTKECGKTLAEAKGEVVYGASFIEWFAEEAKRNYGDVIPSRHWGNTVYTLKQGVGVVGIITPWNFPIAMITRKVGPAIAAGCTVVIKPPSDAPHCALALAYLAEKAGIPKGVIHVLPSRDRTASDDLSLNPLVKKISFTGSTHVGKHLTKLASSTLKKTSMELGGNAPFIVFPDAHLPTAISALIIAKFRCSGQTCVCVNRIFVHDSIHDAFVTRLARAVSAFKVGSGFDSTVTHGPLVSPAAARKCGEHVADALSKGAHLLLGGTNQCPGTHPGGFYYAPTILTGMTDEMLMATDETFGPIAGIFRFSTEEEAVRRANQTEFGLAAYFFSEDERTCRRVAAALECGMVGVNTGVVSAAEAPFGGVKESGFGREGSMYGLAEFQEIKGVTVSSVRTEQ